MLFFSSCHPTATDSHHTAHSATSTHLFTVQHFRHRSPYPARQLRLIWVAVTSRYYRARTPPGFYRARTAAAPQTRHLAHAAAPLPQQHALSAPRRLRASALLAYHNAGLCLLFHSVRGRAALSFRRASCLAATPAGWADLKPHASLYSGCLLAFRHSASGTWLLWFGNCASTTPSAELHPMPWYLLSRTITTSSATSWS